MISCLFCGKAKAEVTHLIMGLTEGVAICDECIGQALILLASKGWVPPTITLTVAVAVNRSADSITLTIPGEDDE